MITRNFKGDELSLLGFGCMRLPVGEGGMGDIDEAATLELFKRAIADGINYFDTAYSYHLGNSERIIGRALATFPRESYYLADKFPGHETRSFYDPKAIFEEQLEKTGADYFDYYLIHNVCELSINTYLDERWGILPYLIEQRRAGRIRHLGFSTHALLPTLERFLESWGEEMEFCQIQLNYLDWTLQHAEKTYKTLRDAGLPIWVMEPVRGGKLASLPEAAHARLAEVHPEWSDAEWALRWVLSLKGVTMVLSGMSTMNQLEENLAIFDKGEGLNLEERALLENVAESLKDVLPCTACGYCLKECPIGLDIPTMLDHYNDARHGLAYKQQMYIESLTEDKLPGACLGCGACARMCPQGIDIPSALADFQAKMDTMVPWHILRKYD